MGLGKLIKPYRVDKPDKFRLSDIDPRDTGGLVIDKPDAKDFLALGTKRLEELQERLSAESRWSVLLILQGMDTAGKDSLIKHVMSGINPQGCDVFSFKAPSHEELAHNFLWRACKCLPERGRIGIFNRSYYEEVLVARVHPEMLARQNLPKPLAGKDIWERRFRDIRGFERHLVENGTVIVKVYLAISKEEQRKRLLARLDEPGKRWKFSMDDVAERARWDEYMAAYEDMIRATSTKPAPWHVIPADNKWFARLLVAAILVQALDDIDPQFPKVEGDALKEMRKVREALEAEASKSKDKGKPANAKTKHGKRKS